MSPSSDDFDYDCLCFEAENDIYNTDQVILFTWSPDPKKYPSAEPRKQYKFVICWLLANARKCMSTFSFVPELNLSGNVHIHGWYVVRDKISYYKWFLPRARQLGFVKVNLMQSKEALNYYRKEINDTVQILGDNLPIPLTHCNWMNYRKIYTKVKLKHKTEYKLNSVIDYFNKK